jgi:hypothetical protein
MPGPFGRARELRRHDAHSAAACGSANVNEALLMKRSKYYIRVMRPVFQRAIFTVEATTYEEALRSSLEQVERLTERDWSPLETERESPVIEIALPDDVTEGAEEADVLEFLIDVQHAYALLQADLESGKGTFIAPTWLKRQPELTVADITQDWAEALLGISDESAEAFYDWLTQQGRPANVVDFFAERDKRRGKPPQDPDAED